MHSVCPSSSRTAVPEATSHTRPTPSPPTVTTRAPPGRMAALLTHALCPCHTAHTSKRHFKFLSTAACSHAVYSLMVMQNTVLSDSSDEGIKAHHIYDICAVACAARYMYWDMALHLHDHGTAAGSHALMFATTQQHD